MKQYIIINGSPRKDGNSDHITDLAVQELEQQGAEVEVFKVREHETKSCVACNSCKATGKCIHQDDAAALIEKVPACDGILFVSPLYFAAAPGTVKVLIDRFYSLCDPAKGMTMPSADRKCGIVLTYGGTPDSEAEKAAGLFTMCGTVAGFGASQVVLCGNENERDAFANNQEYQGKIKELVGWLNGNE